MPTFVWSYPSHGIWDDTSSLNQHTPFHQMFLSTYILPIKVSSVCQIVKCNSLTILLFAKNDWLNIQQWSLKSFSYVQMKLLESDHNTWYNLTVYTQIIKTK